MREVTVVIPAYNEEKTIGKVIHEVEDALEGKTIYEALVVDDGSTDRTASIARSKGARVISYPINRGYGFAIKTGIRNARYDNIVCFDADDSFYGSDILKLLEHADTFDMVIGARTRKEGEPLGRSVLRRLFSAYSTYLMGRKFLDVNSGMRLVKKDKVKEFLGKLTDKFSITTTLTILMQREGFSIVEVPIRLKRKMKGNKLKLLKDGLTFPIMALQMAMYYAPLKVYSPIGIFLLVLSVIKIIYELITGFDVTDSSILLFLSGIQVLFFGLLGDLIVKRTA